MCLIVSEDSYLPHAYQLYSTVKRETWEISLLLCEKNLQQTISQRQINRFDLSHIKKEKFLLNLDKMNSEILKKYDAIYIGLPSNYCNKLINAINENDNTLHLRTICSFPGLLYYIQTYGLWCRAGADLLLFNDKRTLKDYELACRLMFGVDSSNALLFGYPAIRSITLKKSNRKTLLYVDQNIVPRQLEIRRELYHQIILIANERGFERVVFLARNKINERSNHNVNPTSHIATLVNELTKNNDYGVEIIIDYGDPKNWLKSCHMCISINSTVLLFAVHLGIPAVSLNTQGANGRFGGLRFFQKASLAMSSNDLKSGKKVEIPDKKWIYQNICTTTQDKKNDFNIALNKISSADKLGRRLPVKWSKFPYFRKIFELFDAYCHMRM